MIVKLDFSGPGFIADIPAHELPESPLAFNSVRNVMFRGGLAERVSGYKAGFDLTPTQASYGLFAATQVDGTQYLVAGGTNKILCYSGASENDLTGTTTPAATADTKWSGGLLTGFLVLNESTVAPQFIAVSNLSTAGTTNFADLTNWPASTTCKVLRPFKYFLFAADLTEGATRYPFKVRWSTAATPGTLPSSWVASTSNDAGSVDMSDADGRVVDMLPLGDQLAIYQENGITLARYVGGTDAANRLVFAFNRVPVGGNGGIMGLNCVCDVAGIGHVVLSNNDVYVFNGTGITSAIDKRTRRWLFSQMDATNKRRAFVINHASDAEVWVCFPESGQTSCTKALVWNYSDNTLGVRDLPNATAGIHAPVTDSSGDIWSSISGTWADQTATWDSLIPAPISRKTVIASASNLLHVIGGGASANGSTLTAQLQRDYLSFGDAQRVKFFRTLWPRFDGDAGQEISLQIGTSMSVNEAPTWQTEQTYTLGTSRPLHVNRSGRFMHLRIRSTTGTVWKLRSIDVDLQPQGSW